MKPKQYYYIILFFILILCFVRPVISAEVIGKDAGVLISNKQSSAPIIVNGGIVEIFNFSGDVTFEGSGGTLKVTGNSTIESVTIKSGTAVVIIEVLSGVDLTCEEDNSITINSLFNSGDVVFEGDVVITDTFENSDDAEFEDLNLVTGASLVNIGKIYINDNLTITNGSNVVNSGDIEIEDYLYNTNNSSLTNSVDGVIIVTKDVENTLNSSITNNGEIKISKELSNEASVVINNGELYAGKEIYNKNKGSIINSGSMEVGTDIVNDDATFSTLINGTLLVKGDLKNSNSGSILNSGSIVVVVDIENDSAFFSNLINATLVVKGDLKNSNRGSILNSSSIVVAFDIENDSAFFSNLINATLDVKVNLNNYNTGSILNSGSIVVASDIKNDSAFFSNLINATLVVKDDLNNSNRGDFSNAGTVTIKGYIENTKSSTLTNRSSLIVEDVFKNDEAIFVNSTGAYASVKKLNNDNHGVITNSGTIEVTSKLTNDDSSIANSGEISVSDLDNVSRAIFESSGDITVTSTLENEDASLILLEGSETNTEDLNNKESGSITVSGEVTVTDDLKNDDSVLTINETGVLQVNDDLNNIDYATIVNNGLLDVGADLINDKSKLTNGETGEIIVEDNVNNKNNATIINEGTVVVEDNFTQNANLTNSDYIYVEDLFEVKSGATTTLNDGSILQTEDIIVKSDITGVGDYSTLYVTDDTDISNNGSLEGNITFYDENGVEENKGDIDQTVVEYENVIANKVFEFDGDGQYIKVANTSVLNLQTSGTVEAMINLSAYNDFAGIVHKGDYSDWEGDPTDIATDEDYVLRMGGSGAAASNKHVQFFVVAENSIVTVVSSTTSLALNKWYHVLATWDASYLYLYVNGILEQKVALSSAVRATNGDLIIGSLAPDGESSFYPFEGLMDNVRIWNKYQTETEVWDGFGESFDAPVDNLVLNITFDDLIDNSYFNSISNSGLKAYLFNFGRIPAVDIIPEEILDPTTELLDNVVYEYLIINANEMKTLTSNVTCENLLIKATGSLVVPEGYTLTINGDLFIKSDAVGCGQMFINGSIIIEGNVHIEHTFKGDGGWEFLTVPATLTDFSLLGNDYDVDYVVYYYDQAYRATSGPNSGVWKRPSVLQPGVGYIFAFSGPKSVIFDVSASNYLSATNEEFALDYTFSDLSEDQAGWNLIGNPFQTTVSWDKVVDYVENTVIGGDVGAAIYFYDSASGNYMTYVDGESANGMLDGTIKPLDAFFVKAYDTGNQIIVKRNLFPESLIERGASLVKKKVLRVEISDATSSDGAIITLVDNATDEFDSRYDAHKAFGAASLCQVYTESSDGKKLAINAMSSSDLERDMTLFVRCAEVGNYKFTFKNVESLTDEYVYLIDKQDGTYVNLKDDATYNFNTTKKGYLNRFMIVFRSSTVTSNATNRDELSMVYYFDGYIKLLNNTDRGTLRIFDMQGKNVSATKVRRGDISIATQLNPGIYIITLNDISRKIIID